MSLLVSRPRVMICLLMGKAPPFNGPVRNLMEPKFCIVSSVFKQHLLSSFVIGVSTGLLTNTPKMPSGMSLYCSVGEVARCSDTFGSSYDSSACGYPCASARGGSRRSFLEGKGGVLSLPW